MAGEVYAVRVQVLELSNWKTSLVRLPSIGC
jgi:hypothetical protein